MSAAGVVAKSLADSRKSSKLITKKGIVFADISSVFLGNSKALSLAKNSAVMGQDPGARPATGRFASGNIFQVN